MKNSRSDQNAVRVAGCFYNDIYTKMLKAAHAEITIIILYHVCQQTLQTFITFITNICFEN